MLSLQAGIRGKEAMMMTGFVSSNLPGVDVVERVLGQVRVAEEFHNILGQEQIALVRRYGEGEGGQGFLRARYWVLNGIKCCLQIVWKADERGACQRHR